MFFMKKNAGPRQEMVIPAHIGIIMDGNGRWAKKRGLPRKAGHRYGAKAMEEICKYARDIGVRYLTLYAFSTENWKRPQDEVDSIMNLLRNYLKDITNHQKEEIRTKFIGDRSGLAPDIVALMEEAEEKGAHFDKLTVNFAINYGGRDEIVHAVREIGKKIQDGALQPSDIDEQTLEDFLYTAGQPAPDLIIRPSGEFRTSNFMVWQSAYSELVFMDVLWPDFGPKDLDRAIEEYSRRNRRFGGV
ncbi:isoprenyl transferase [Candidatus Soleaferrea massiliensis]|uniref:isoprenyl transferase n=1 Tax=Candidatus Soleaferrea massiliensis TaxID=1470354 RepID=UPI0006942CB1|nr:isoprenyl transferase [Candidatus Soleaferrea massiliensis]